MKNDKKKPSELNNPSHNKSYFGKIRPKLEDFYDISDPRGCSTTEYNIYEKELNRWKVENKLD